MGDLKAMQGTWTIKVLEKGGEQPPKELLKATVSFVESKMAIELSAANSHDGKGFTRSFTVQIDPSKKPKAIDLTPVDEPYKGEILPGIYSIKGNELKLCVPNGKIDKRPSEMKSPEGSSLIIMTLIRSDKR